MHDISELVGEVGETPDRFAVGADDDVAQDPGIEIDAAQAGEPATVRRITNPSTPSASRPFRWRSLCRFPASARVLCR
jgi:hypothetical protein